MSVFSVTALDRLIESLDDRTAAASRGGGSRLASAVEQCCSAASSLKSVASSYASSFKGSHPGNESLVRPSPRVELGNGIGGVCRVSLLSPTSPLHIPGSRYEGVDPVGVRDQVGFSLSPGGPAEERPAEEHVGILEGKPCAKRVLSWERSRTLRRLLAAQPVEAGREDSCRPQQSSDNRLEGLGDSRLQDSVVAESGSVSHLAGLEYPADRPCSSPHPSNRSGEEFADASDVFFDGSLSDDEGSLSSRVSSRRDPFPGLLSYRELALQLQREIEKRRQVEGVVSALQEELEVRQLCSVVPFGVHGTSSAHCSVPAIGLETSGEAKVEDEWHQRLAVARMLSAAIARGAAKAEAQEELDNIVGDKNRELSRYRDKIQYYEILLHEMSQINQQSIESARQKRRRRQRVTRWILSSIGAAVCLGLSAAAAAHRYGVWDHVKDLEWGSGSLGDASEDLGDSPVGQVVSCDTAAEL